MTVREKHVFICYSSQDRQFADRIVSFLRDCGVRVWLDRSEIKAGDSITGKIEAAISEAAYVLVILSDRSVESTWVKDELRLAMTRQREEQKRLVIPLLYRDCPMPPFLKDRHHIDFRNRRNFVSSANLLLAAIDADEYRSNDANFGDLIAHEPPLSQLAALEPDLQKSFKELPVSTLWSRAVELNSFSGAFRDEMLTCLSVISHDRDTQGVSIPNLLSFVAFLKEVEKRNLTEPHLLQLLVAIVESRSIHTYYRRQVVPTLKSRYSALTTRRQKLALLPDIFTNHGVDPLVTMMLEEFLNTDSEDKERRLCCLWEMGSQDYREEIVTYVLRVGRWAKKPVLPEHLTANPDPESLRKALREGWQKVSVRFNTRASIINALEHIVADSVARKIQVEDVVRIIEEASVLPSEGSIHGGDLVLAFLSTDNLRKIHDIRGAAFLFKILASLIASPFIDPAASVVALWELNYLLGLDALKYDARFPAGLLLPKAFNLDEGNDFAVLKFSLGLSPMKSLLDFVNNDNGLDTYFILFKLTQLFPSEYFHVGVLRYMADMDPSPRLKLLRSYICEEISLSQMKESLEAMEESGVNE